MVTQKKILLLGCGYVLKRVAKLVGYERVVATSRTQKRISDLQNLGLQVVPTDIADSKQIQALSERFGDFDTIVDSIPPLSIDGTNLHTAYEPLMAALTRFEGRVIYLSTTGVYGRSDGEIVTEVDVPRPATDATRNRLTVETLYKQHARHHCAVRIPAIYGPGRGIGTALRMGRFRLIEDGNRWSNRVHVEDLAAILAHLIKSPTIPELVNACDDTPALQREVVEFYCKHFNIPLPSSMPLSEARALGMDTLLGNQRISNHLLKTLLKTPLKYPSYREGAGTEF